MYIRHFRVHVVPLIVRLSDVFLLRGVAYGKEMQRVWRVVHPHLASPTFSPLFSPSPTPLSRAYWRSSASWEGEGSTPPPPIFFGSSTRRRRLLRGGEWAEAADGRWGEWWQWERESTAAEAVPQGKGGGMVATHAGAAFPVPSSVPPWAGSASLRDTLQDLEDDLVAHEDDKDRWERTGCAAALWGTPFSNTPTVAPSPPTTAAPTRVYIHELVVNPLILRVWWCRDARQDAIAMLMGGGSDGTTNPQADDWDPEQPYSTTSSLLHAMRASFEDVRVTVPGVLNRRGCRTVAAWGRWAAAFLKDALVGQLLRLVLQYASSIPLLGAPVLLMRGITEGATRFFVSPMAVFDPALTFADGATGPSARQGGGGGLLHGIPPLSLRLDDDDEDGSGRLLPSSTAASPFFFTSLLDQTFGFTSDVMSGGLGAVSNISKTGVMLLDSAMNVGGSVSSAPPPPQPSRPPPTHSGDGGGGALTTTTGMGNLSLSYLPFSTRRAEDERRNRMGRLQGGGGGPPPRPTSSASPSSSSSSSSSNRPADSFLSGVGKGFLGAFQRPFEGAKEEGLFGAVRGLAQGVVGVVAQPMAGLLSDVSSVTDAVSQLLSDRFIPDAAPLPSLCAFGCFGTPRPRPEVEETFEYQRGMVLRVGTRPPSPQTTGRPRIPTDKSVVAMGNRVWSGAFLSSGSSSDGPEWHPWRREEVCQTTAIRVGGGVAEKGPSPTSNGALGPSKRPEAPHPSPPRDTIVARRVPYPLAGWKIDMGAGTIEGWLYGPKYQPTVPEAYHPWGMVDHSSSGIRRRRWVLLKQERGSSLMVVTDYAAEVIPMP